MIDSDSAMAIEGKFPGLLDAINTAKGKKSIEVLEDYASYDDPQAQIFVIESPSNQISTPPQKQPTGKMMIFGGSSGDDFAEFLVAQG